MQNDCTYFVTGFLNFRKKCGILLFLFSTQFTLCSMQCTSIPLIQFWMKAILFCVVCLRLEGVMQH